MPNIMDYESAEAWQEAWNAWNESRATGRQARIRAARSNAAQRGAQTKRSTRRNQRAAATWVSVSCEIDRHMWCSHGPHDDGACTCACHKTTA